MKTRTLSFWRIYYSQARTHVDRERYFRGLTRSGRRFIIRSLAMNLADMATEG